MSDRSTGHIILNSGHAIQFITDLPRQEVLDRLHGDGPFLIINAVNEVGNEVLIEVARDQVCALIFTPTSSLTVLPGGARMLDKN